MKYISLNEVMWELTNNPLVSNMSHEEAAQHAMSLLKLMKIPLSMSTVVEKFDVVDHKVRLPDSLITVNAVRNVENDQRLIYSVSEFHLSDKEDKGPCHNMSYVLQNCNIITSFESGTIEVSYLKFELDEEGFPLIPDNESLIQAIKYHIMTQYSEPLWMMGKITDKAFNHITQMRAWYIGQAGSALKLVNLDHATAMMNGLNRIIVNTQSHQNHYKDYGVQERIKRYH